MIPKEPWNKYFCICLNSDIISNIPERELKLQEIYDIISYLKKVHSKEDPEQPKINKNFFKCPLIPTALTLPNTI